MKLTDENGNMYEFVCEKYKLDEWLQYGGLLKPIEKAWPQEGDKYFFVNTDGETEHDNYGDWSKKHKMNGNCFKTKEEAELARDRIQSLQKAKIKICVRHFSEQGGMRTEDFIELTIPKKYLKAWKALEDKK